eukprot:g63711.t1
MEGESLAPPVCLPTWIGQSGRTLTSRSSVFAFRCTQHASSRVSIMESFTGCTEQLQLLVSKSLQSSSRVTASLKECHDLKVIS